MCELFAYCGSRRAKLNKDLKEFFSHSHQHPDGWGMADFSDGGFLMEKEPTAAYKSKYLKERLSEEISSDLLLAHIRKATIGNEERCNCHPFSAPDDDGRRWTLIHNGTIFDYAKLNDYTKKQEGATDSERILLYMLDKLNAKAKKIGRPLNLKERFDCIEAIVNDMAYGNKLNLILYDGDMVYVHYNYANTLFKHDDEDGVTISTQPLNDKTWTRVPFMRLIAYDKGKISFIGDVHDGQYFDDSELEKYLYLAYAGL